jgi:hypothetical protein
LKEELPKQQKVRKSKIERTILDKKRTSSSSHDVSYRSKSAMYYANRDSITFEHGEIPSSLPSSPSRMKRASSSNGTNVITSEVFTRTIDSSKSIEVIFRQPSSATSSQHDSIKRMATDKYVSDVDASFIETTDSSLSDSIALPSSTSDHENVELMLKRRQPLSPTSPVATKTPLQLIEEKSFIIEASTPSTTTSTAVESQCDESQKLAASTIGQDIDSISPMLEFQVVSPQRQKYKFNYETKTTGNSLSS